MSLAVVILAAGQGTRMNSKTQKILHEVGGKPMVTHAFEAAQAIADGRPVLVVGSGEAGVSTLFAEEAVYVTQPQQLGTGHATLMARAALQGQSDQVLVTYGDMPLLRAETMRRLAEAQADSGAAIALLSVEGTASSSFGRVLRDETGGVIEIVEVAEARRRPDGAQILAVTELNVGVYCFDAPWLWRTIDDLPLRQARNGQEYYLTDLVEMAVAQGQQVVALTVEDPDECLGAGTRLELAAVEKAFRKRASRRWLARGVTLIDPDAVYIDQDVVIGQDTVIWPNTFLQGRTIIGQDSIVGPNTIIRNATIGDACVIEQAVVENAHVPDGTNLRPFTLISDDPAQH